ncbi:C39 family peptidase [Lacticaseibacillus brantae]|uniref:Peptidase C39-like domain-containing protein n=1 Tax=Lacticaseibacillus brantae DSM 23927 TaxID=1423727 RepID=A0A0R2B9C0_9LACO|nr:C39 family peptidase [Lacticaseibacillus brantae]KRM72236.1 hypothetical protein FC34_GL001221 [Lacticaseibacillus brantae DSM 23927]
MIISDKLKHFCLVSLAALTMLSPVAGVGVHAADGQTPVTTTAAQTTAANDFVAQAFVGQVNYVPGYGINLWQFDANNQRSSSRKLAHGTSWKVFGYQVINGTKYYNLGGNQWLDARYIVDASTVSDETKLSNSYATVSYAAGYGIAAYQRTGKGMTMIPNKKLKNGSEWKAFASTTHDGATWYDLGGNQWVNGKYVVVGQVAKQSVQLDVPYWSQYKPVFAPWGCASTALAMILGYDGVKIDAAWLKNAQDNLPMYPADPNGQKGNPYTGVGFGFVINSTGLTRYGQHFDKNVVDVSGASTDTIKRLVLSGHPVLYYGWSSYQNLSKDKNRNHDKVIVGYKDGQFLVHDPLYSYSTSAAGTGGSKKGGNATYDRGAIAWEPVSLFNAEYAGHAITLQK